MKYDVDYFLNKFDAIPANEWTIGEFINGQKCCALGHCGYRPGSLFHNEETSEGVALTALIARTLGLGVVSVNDGYLGLSDLGDTPKERIMNVLIMIKAGVKV